MDHNCPAFNSPYENETMASADDDTGSNVRKRRRFSNEEYTIGWICALTTEYVAATVFLDQEHATRTHTATRGTHPTTVSVGYLRGHHSPAATFVDTTTSTGDNFRNNEAIASRERGLSPKCIIFPFKKTLQSESQQRRGNLVFRGATLRVRKCLQILHNLETLRIICCQCSVCAIIQ